MKHENKSFLSSHQLLSLYIMKNWPSLNNSFKFDIIKLILYTDTHEFNHTQSCILFCICSINRLCCDQIKPAPPYYSSVSMKINIKPVYYQPSVEPRYNLFKLKMLMSRMFSIKRCITCDSLSGKHIQLWLKIITTQDKYSLCILFDQPQ